MNLSLYFNLQVLIERERLIVFADCHDDDCDVVVEVFVLFFLDNKRLLLLRQFHIYSHYLTPTYEYMEYMNTNKYGKGKDLRLAVKID